MLVKDDDELVSETETKTFTSSSALVFVSVIYFGLKVVLPIIRQTRGKRMYNVFNPSHQGNTDSCRHPAGYRLKNIFAAAELKRKTIWKQSGP